MLNPKKFEKDEFIYKKGETASNIYFLEQGTLEFNLYVSDDDPHRFLIGSVGPGECFGMEGFLCSMARGQILFDDQINPSKIKH